MARRLTPQMQAVALQMGIKRLEEYKQMCEDLTPSVYAAVAIALYEKGWRYQRINDLFMRSEELWTENCDDTRNMIEMCEDMTGIKLQAEVS